MFRKIIVGVDARQGGRDASALANSLVANDGSVTYAHVFIHSPVSGRGAHLDFERQRAQELHSAAREEMHEFAQLRCIDSSSVGRGLHELADAERADLLVVGSCRRGLIGRVMVGDETSEALNGAPCAVAVAPYGHAERPTALGEIGVAYDGSLESEGALAFARELAAEHGARLSAFEAVSVPAYLTAPGAGAAIETLPALVEEARVRISGLGGVEPHAAYGVAAEELAVYSASLDLLVTGSRGYGPLGRLVHGSTSRRLARTARCPVLVLARGPRAARQPVSVPSGLAAATATAG
jgi:nucleotide-binding universal stress UspA family protein